MDDAEFWELYGEWGKGLDGTPLSCSVQTHEGDGQDGPVFSSPHSHPGLPQFPQSRLVRTAQGNEALSQTRLYAPMSLAGHFTLGSLVTPASGQRGAVLTLSQPEAYGLFGFVVVDLE